jgi:hypothetical protein
MEAREFRVGNLIFINDSLRTVEGIVGDQVWFKKEKHLSQDLIINCNPVPLTEGWLLRMGFEKNSEYYSYSNEFVPLVIIYDSEESRVYIQGAEDELRLSSRMFKNVHELQNLVFTILGTELTIKG